MEARSRMFLVVGLLVTLGVAVGLSQVSTDDPDGLEYVAEREGFAESAEDHDLADFALADYGEGLTGNSVVDTAVAGLVGVLLTLGLGWIVFRLVGRREDPSGGAG